MIRLRCPCGHEWVTTFNLPMEIRAFSKALKEVRCPACGNGKGLAIPTRKEANERDK